MATIRKTSSGKYEVQVRRKGFAPLSRSFHHHVDAEQWARHMEVKADRGELPMDVIRQVKERTQGIFFNSIIPDVYSSFAASSVVDRFLYSWEPLAISGLSQHSNGQRVMSVKKDEMAKIDFFQENKKTFHPQAGTGLVQSVPILVYESFLQSAHLRGADVGLNKVQQLAIAVAHAPQGKSEEVVGYCKEIAGNNNLDFQAVLKQSRIEKVKKKARRIVFNFSRVLLPVNSGKKATLQNDPKILNIFDAANETAALLRL